MLTELPDWARALVTAMPERATPEELMRLATRLASGSVEHGGGPFGAVVADAEGRVVGVGWNRVVETHDPTAHAEMLAIRHASRALGTHVLRGLTMYASCAPCIQCFGAIWWSGIQDVQAAADAADAERLGFSEGPVDAALWARAAAVKGIRYSPGFLREEGIRPLATYARRAGPIY